MTNYLKYRAAGTPAKDGLVLRAMFEAMTGDDEISIGRGAYDFGISPVKLPARIHGSGAEDCTLFNSGYGFSKESCSF